MAAYGGRKPEFVERRRKEMRDEDKFMAVAMGLLAVGLFVLLAKAHAFAPDPTQQDNVHAHMSNILEEEAPRDASGIEFEQFGKIEVCTVWNQTHSEDAVVETSTQASAFSGKFVRKTEHSREWVLGGFNVHTYTDQGRRDDGDAVSEPEFRRIVHECVAAARRERQRKDSPLATTAENERSWVDATPSNP
jgi:hypothetical protein